MSKKARPNITGEDIEGYYLSPDGILYQLKSFVPEPQATMVAVRMEAPEISRELSYFKDWTRLVPEKKRARQVSIHGPVFVPDTNEIPENQTQIAGPAKRHRRTKAEIQVAQDKSVARIVSEGDDFRHLNIKIPTESGPRAVNSADDELYHISVTIDNAGAIAEGKTLREAIVKLIPDVESIPAEFTARGRDVVESFLRGN